LCTGKLNHEFLTVSSVDWAWLSVFAIVGTAFPFIASVNLMKHISPYTVTLTVNLETVYGITLAYFIWKKDEAMTPGFYLGTLIILATIFGNSILKGYLKRKVESSLPPQV
jgi:drug/metabolite transporter (DMT)-like permease